MYEAIPSPRKYNRTLLHHPRCPAGNCGIHDHLKPGNAVLGNDNEAEASGTSDG